jgi:hypothetical protein
VRLPDVDQGQHHENKGLQRNDQNVEDGPDGASNDVTNRQQNAAQT